MRSCCGGQEIIQTPTDCAVPVAVDEFPLRTEKTSGGVRLVGDLSLRRFFAMRTNRFAQDDKTYLVAVSLIPS